MSEEVFIPKMKRIDKKQKKVKISLLNFVLIFFGILLLVASTFINIDLRHYILPSGFFKGENLVYEDFITGFSFIPQIPVLMFVCSALGKKMAITSVILYILAGIVFFPLFALGGGIQYLGEYSFGYIFAYIPVAVIIGQILEKKYSFLNMFYAVMSGVFIIHCLGLLYMILVALIRHDGGDFILSWIVSQSGVKILYDLVASYVCVLIGKYFNSFIKYVLS